MAAPVRPGEGAYSTPDKNKPDIDNFVKLNLQNLLNDSNTDAQGKARENLEKATLTTGGTASPAFLYEYGQSLNTALTAALQKKPTLRQRLNIAIVTAKFAYLADKLSTTLQTTTMALLQDKAEPVVLWGLKAAQPQVPQLLKMAGAGGKAPPLVAAIVPAVFNHPSGPVFEEGYQALSGDDKIIFDELTKLWQNRLVQYQTKVPQDPSADGRPVFKLTGKDMWAAAVKDDATKVKVMQMIVDQLSAAQQWADKGGQGDTHAQLVALARQCAGGCVVVGTTQKLPDLTRLANAAYGQLDPKSFQPTTKLGPIVDPVVKQVLTSFAGVKEPPQVGPTPPAGPGANGVAGQPQQ